MSSQDSVIPSKKMSYYRWFVLGFLFIIYTIANADRANIGFVLPFIQKEYNLSNTLAGLLASLFFIGYSLFQIPSGFLIKKFGVRVSYSAGMFLTSLFTGLMGLVNSVLMLKVLRLLVGISEAPVGLGSTTTINNWFPAKEKGTAAGLFLVGSKIGPLIVPPLCAWIILYLGWRYIFVLFAIPGALLSIVWFFMVPDHPEDSPFVSKEEADYIRDDSPVPLEKESHKKTEIFRLNWLDKIIRTKKAKELTSTKEVFECWDIYGAAIGYFFMVGLVSVMMSWLPKYLLQERGFAIMSSAFLAASPFAGTVVGNLIGGYLSDTVFNKRRKPLMLVSALTSIFTMYALIHAPANMYLLAVLLFTTGICLSLGYSAFSVYPMGRVDKATYSVAFSVVNMGGQLGGACMPFFVGIILDYSNWPTVFMVLALGFVLCFLAVLSIIEPMPKGVEIIEYTS